MNVWSRYLDRVDSQYSTAAPPYAPNKQQALQRSFSDTPTPTSTSEQSQAQPPPQTRGLATATTIAGRNGNAVAYRTRSIGGPFSAGVTFERYIDLSPPTDDEIIIATVRVTNNFRRASVEGCEELPSRPPARGFLRRMSTRISGSPDNDCRYTAMKMTRRDYKRYFARDKDGNYAGTEPEREWSEQDLQRDFGVYQDMALRSIPGFSEYGEGDKGASSPGSGRASPGERGRGDGGALIDVG